MEALVLLGGFLFTAGAGYFAIVHLGRFLDSGGISPCWDEEEEQAEEKEISAKPDPLTE